MVEALRSAALDGVAHGFLTRAGGVSRGAVEPVWDAEAGEFRPRTMMPLSLSYDHRLIDGADAARFLRLICETIEDPYLMSLAG